MHLRTITWLLLLSLNVAFGEQKQDNIDWQPWSDAVFAQAKKELLTMITAEAGLAARTIRDPGMGFDRFRRAEIEQVVDCSHKEDLPR